MPTIFQQQLVTWAKSIANDNTYYYYYSWQDWRQPPHFDCATYLSYVIYKAMGWNDWYDPSHGGIGYFWPHIDDPGYDTFLLDNGWQKYPYNSSLLTEGAIIITTETLGHTLMYVGNNELCDGNDFGGTDHGSNSIAVRTFPFYDPNEFAYIYIPPDVPMTFSPDGIGTALSHDEVTEYYNSIPDSWTLADLKAWVQAQPFYSWVNDEIFYLSMGWTEGEDYFTQSLEGSYLCGCCPINNCYHAGATDYNDFMACMYLSGSYYSYANLMNRGQNASAACVKIMTLCFANPNTEASLFYGEYYGWVPSDYIPYSPLCYDQGIQIWSIPERGWTLTITGTGVRNWIPGPGPMPGRYCFRTWLKRRGLR